MNIDQNKIIESAVSDAVQHGVNAIPLDEINVSDPRLFQSNSIWAYFERLRNEDPVHYCKKSDFGPFWSITKYKDIMEVEMNPEVFSSATENGGITIIDGNLGLGVEMFIGMDNPEHDKHRKAVNPMLSAATIARLEGTIRERTLTTLMLATLFDFPLEDRKLLTHWSEVATAMPGAQNYVSAEYKKQELDKCLEYFTRLWKERAKLPPAPDFISMMAHSDATKNITPDQFLGNLILLIVGGNDTTRNSMSASILALSQNPDQYKKLCANPKLVESMVPEIIRWQTPLASMRRTAVADYELGGKQIKKGDKVVMWYVSANRDEEAIETPEQFIIDRRRPRQHLAFGFGVHRCMGNRLAEMQIRVLWEEILNIWPKPCIHVVGEPTRVYSCILRGYENMPVQINP